jgi:hypothetical protein
VSGETDGTAFKRLFEAVAVASRRRYVPKADGRLRPLGIAALEDKIVQAASASASSLPDAVPAGV